MPRCKLINDTHRVLNQQGNIPITFLCIKSSLRETKRRRGFASCWAGKMHFVHSHAVVERIFHWLGRDAQFVLSASSGSHVSTRRPGHSVVVCQLVVGRASGVCAYARDCGSHFSRAW